MNTNYTKPFLKWAGNKFRLLEQILSEQPRPCRLYIEPFAGAASVYLNIQAEKALVCDLNRDLIALYQYIQKQGIPFIEYSQSFFTIENKESNYYQLRKQFNISKDTYERAALLLYLNRHCFNGLVRFNSKGEFNVPFGQYKEPYFPKKEMLQFYKKTQQVETFFRCWDFKDTLKIKTEAEDFIYCDPPYVPLSKTASFTNYTAQGFSLENQKSLAQYGQRITLRKGKGRVCISNHDTPETRGLYRHARLKFFDVQRQISCQAEGRKKVPELLAIF